jgi:hypothetical protein
MLKLRHSLFGVAAVLAGLGWASAGPDYWVGLSGGGNGTNPPAHSVPGGMMIRVILTVGNSGAPGTHPILAWVTARNGTGNQEICNRSVTIQPPTQGHAVTPVAIEFFYRGATAMQFTRPPRIGRTTYDLHGAVAETIQPYEEDPSLRGNDAIDTKVVVPAGAQISCRSMGLPVRRP